MKMDDTELDGLVEYLRGKDFCPEAADVITAMRAEIAELSLQACQDGDLISELIVELNEQIEGCDRAEKQLAEARAGELAWTETAKLHLKAEQAFLSWLRDAGEHLRDEGVTICDDGTDSGEVLAAKVAECVGLLKARADRAEAALAAPEVMHEDAPAAIVGEIGNQIHNLGCELQNDEDVSLRLSDLACRCWDAAKLFPTDRAALDRVLAQTREVSEADKIAIRNKALREAADELKGRGYNTAVRAILALIEKEKPE